MHAHTHMHRHLHTLTHACIYTHMASGSFTMKAFILFSSSPSLSSFSLSSSTPPPASYPFPFFLSPSLQLSEQKWVVESVCVRECRMSGHWDETEVGQEQRVSWTQEWPSRAGTVNARCPLEPCLACQGALPCPHLLFQFSQVTSMDDDCL